MNTTEEIYFFEAKNFLNHLLNELKDLGINPSLWDIDHLCYRTQSQDHYENVKNDFLKFSKLLIETHVNGRLIATFKLKSPWDFGDHLIDLVEVPAPKPNKETKPGFEHIEVVVAKSFEEIQKTYPQLSFEDNQHHKIFNPELVANLKQGDIKFHHQSLEVIINIEKLDGVLENLLHHFNFPKIPFFVCGTYPIGINTSQSDIDVSVSYSKNEKIKILEWIENFQNQTIHPLLKIQGDTLSFHFKSDPFSYDFFMNTEDLYKHHAYRHLNIEMRLLKIFGDNLKTEVKKLKKEGIKTELAFLKALSIESSPENAFDDIFQLEELSDHQIKLKYKV